MSFSLLNYITKQCLQGHGNHEWREEGVTEVAFTDSPVSVKHGVVTLTWEQSQPWTPAGVLRPSAPVPEPCLPKVPPASEWARWHCGDNTKSTHSGPIQYSSGGQFRLRDFPLAWLRSSENYTEVWSSPHPNLLPSFSLSPASDLRQVQEPSPPWPISPFLTFISVFPSNSALLHARPAECSSHSPWTSTAVK